MTDQPAGIVGALVAFQAALPNVGKVSTAQYGNYADLADVSGIVLPRLAQVGLAYTAYLIRDVDTLTLRCQLSHTSGESLTSDWPVPLGSSQAMGSALTYGRRYCLLALCGVHPAGEDDDAQLATKEHAKLARDTVKAPRKATRSSSAKDDDEWTVPPVTHTPPRPPNPPSRGAGAELLTAPQLKMIVTLMGDKGIVDKDAVLDYVAGAVGRQVESRKNLTRAEAGMLIDALTYVPVDVETGEMS